MKKIFRIASFDVGKVNFAQYVEDVDTDKVLKLEEKYKKLPKKFKRRVRGPMNSLISELLEEMYLTGTRIQTGVYDLREDKESKKLDLQTRVNIILHLNKYMWVWDKCDVFVIEQQFFKTWGRRGKKSKGGSEANVDAIKVAEAIMTWFLVEYPSKTVIYFGSSNKTLMLGAPCGLGDNKRKKWAIQKTRDIYEKRNDYDMIELFKLSDRIYRKHLNKEEKIQGFIDSYQGKSDDGKYLAKRLVRERQKLDDISDACLQAQAFKFKTMVGCF